MPFLIMIDVTTVQRAELIKKTQGLFYGAYLVKRNMKFGTVILIFF